MYRHLFHNRWAALLFVGVTMFGVANLVGPEGEEGVLVQAASDLETRQATMAGEVQAFDEATTPPGAAGAPPVAGGFMDDEDLIDDTAGIDPTPPTEEPIPDVAEEGEVVIVSRDGGDIEQIWQ